MSQLYGLNDMLDDELKHWKNTNSITENVQDRLSNVIVKATEQLNNLSNVINNISSHNNVTTFPTEPEEEVVGGRKKIRKNYNHWLWLQNTNKKRTRRSRRSRKHRNNKN